MLFLFETAAGYALFKVVKEGKLEKSEVGWGAGRSLFKVWLSSRSLARVYPAVFCTGCLCRRKQEATPAPADTFYHRPQDLYKDFETLDAAQKVGFSRWMDACTSSDPTATAARRRLPPPPAFNQHCSRRRRLTAATRPRACPLDRSGGEAEGIQQVPKHHRGAGRGDSPG
jgi:hypothetical protein